MSIRKTKSVIWIASLTFVLLNVPSWAQTTSGAKGQVQSATQASGSVSADTKGQAQSATQAASGVSAGTKGQVQSATQASSSVSAELVKGKLNPASSKPGDKIAVRLNDDVRSNGSVLLKKGTTITGVVKNARQADSKSKTSAKSSAQSMMEIEWLTPAASGVAAQNLNIALQSLSYTNPIFAQQQNEESGFAGTNVAAARPVQQSSGGSSSRSGGLLGGVGGAASSTVSSATSIGGTTSGAIGGVTSAGTGVAGTVSSTAGSTTSVAAQSGTGLVALSSLPAADAGIASSLRDNFGVSGGPIYSMGHGQIITADGSRNGVDLFSHLSNDTVITSPGRNFEVSSGAQMQLLVGAPGR